MGSHQHGNKGVEVTPFKTKGANLGRETCRYVQGHRQPRVTDVLVLPRRRAVPLAILPGGIFLSTEDTLMAISIFDIAKKKSKEKYLPHDHGHQTHDGFVKRVKELSQGLPLLLHVSNHESEAHGEDNESQGIDPVHRPWDWD